MNPTDKSIFKKDMLDKCKLKNAKRRFKEFGQHKQKPTLIYTSAI